MRGNDDQVGRQRPGGSDNLTAGIALGSAKLNFYLVILLLRDQFGELMFRTGAHFSTKLHVIDRTEPSRHAPGRHV
jgi:galactitol-specific phosphotransferase system IIC component